MITLMVIVLGVLMLMAGLYAVAESARRFITAIGAVMCLGLMGYVLQGRPQLPTAPIIAREPIGANQAEQAFAEARAASAKDPKNAMHWVSMANALTARNQGVLATPAEFAYRKALMLDPHSLQALYFYGIGLAEAGRVDEAREHWITMARQIPASEPQRPTLVAAMVATGIVSEADVKLLK